MGRKTLWCLQLLQGEEAAGSRSCCAGTSLVPCLTQVHPCYCGSHRGPALPGDLSAAPGTAGSCGTASVTSAGREGLLLPGLCTSFPTQLCSDRQGVPVCACSVGFGLGGDSVAPRILVLLLCFPVGIPLMKEESLLKSRNLWDQICAFSVLQHL